MPSAYASSIKPDLAVPDASFFKRPTLPPFESKPRPAEPPIPEKIGIYTIETLLDKGGMSFLYLASHPESQAPITIKVLSPKFLSHPEMTSRFLKEAEIIALADHPNIVKLFGYGEWEGGLYIAMEFVQGVSLRQYLLQNPVSLRKALEIVLEIAYALCHLHTHGVIHRDLKPENILIDETGHAKVIDFGIAQLIDPFAVEKEDDGSQQRRLVGTPVYMSPEQRENPETVSYPSDIYSLGIITYELVLGKLSEGQVHLSLMPKGLQKILAKALQPRLSERYLDIVDFISDVSSYLHSPRFEKEKKVGDQAGELFEKFQILQQKLIPTETEGLQVGSLELGLVIHRPLGFSAVYADIIKTPPSLFLGESPSLEVEGLMQLLYLRGALDAIVNETLPLTELARLLNKALLNAPINLPLPFAALRWKLEEELLEALSCGYGLFWKVSSSQKIESFSSPNMALGLLPDASFEMEKISFKEGDCIVMCPLSNTGVPFSAAQFRDLLKEFGALSPQKMADALYRKAKSQNIRYFDERPFLVAVCLRPLPRE